jgi:hypothetical protein
MRRLGQQEYDGIWPPGCCAAQNASAPSCTPRLQASGYRTFSLLENLSFQLADPKFNARIVGTQLSINVPISPIRHSRRKLRLVRLAFSGEDIRTGSNMFEVGGYCENRPKMYGIYKKRPALANQALFSYLSPIDRLFLDHGCDGGFVFAASSLLLNSVC